ncbi:hypothetical protein BDV96DRAFT_87934 [Lophiotrema nucula]|uniref:SET domain-containing protein n=1 Tax=Lophiotrema nucula TaxID=690887 RepID=A0A6A5Z6G1_9PLEO|nr:hypothetical protein BDV96DRAFT_87934 [Lophiotrema nucula]
MSSFDDTSRQFLAWLSKSGAEVSNKIELQDLRAQQAGRGVVAVQDIEEDELLFRIPRSSILSVENSILSKEIPEATFGHLGPWLSLILVMLYEYQNGDASHWAPYFRVLPEEFNTLMFWEDDELKELQASAVVSKIGKAGADDSFLKELIPVIQEFADIFFSSDENASQRANAMKKPHNLQLMHKMGSLIMAYAFDVEPAENNKEVDEEGYVSEDEDEALPKGMVPLADMLNADGDKNNARLFYEESSLSMKALKPIKAGEEIFNDYGPLPRSDLLRRYGYITDNYAQYDVVEVPFEMVTEAVAAEKLPNIDERVAYLDEQCVIDTGYDITTTSPFVISESVSTELVVLIKTLLLPEDEFKRLKSRGKLPKPDNIPLQGAQLLQAIVKARAAQYPTSLEEDLHDMTMVSSDGQYTSPERRIAMAKQVRIGEKGILKGADEALMKLVQELGTFDRTAKRVVEEVNGAPRKRQRAI